ncbi:hypothetical protein BD769DRAFT_1668537 [Suillus cothurnatus]|nr:hypothetical protein BD769DRAFT_1668537 [Suillus cothurnatus]
MPHTCVHVPPFYQADGPPQQLPLLTYHTEILYPTASFVLISPQEEIAFSTHTLRGRTRTPSRVFTTSTLPVPAGPPTPKLVTSRSPTPKFTKAVSFSADQISRNGELVKMSMYSSSILSTDSNDSKIPKPDGEAGRPARGGYNLERALNWDSSRFKLLRDFVHRSIDSHCDTSKSKSSQTPAALNSVETEAVVQFPELNDYMGRWPVGDLIQMQLKNLSAKERQRHAKKNNSQK